MPSIVTVNVSQQSAPAPSTLQQTIAFVSADGTTNAVGSLTLLTGASALAAMLKGSKACTIGVSGFVMTLTDSGGHGFTVGDEVELTLAGMTSASAAYNTTFPFFVTSSTVMTTTCSGVTTTITGSPVYTPEDVAELVQMNNTWWAQGNSVPVYVLELGVVGSIDGPPALNTWIQAHLQTVYGWIIPRSWDSDSPAPLLALLAQYEAPTALTYFFVTTTTNTYTNYTAVMKDAFVLLEAPALPVTEFTNAAPARSIAALRPSSGNRVGPFAFTQEFGVTPYPVLGNGTLLTTLKAAATNVILTGAEGGLANTYVYWGQTKDGNDFEYWYAIDWTQINSKLVLANEVINGSNNPINPLIYNQPGINRLQDRIFSLLGTGVANGLLNGVPTRTNLTYADLLTAIDNGEFAGDLVINAQPLQDYLTANPNDYGTGTYSGLSCLITPSRGFTSILINLEAFNFTI